MRHREVAKPTEKGLGAKNSSLVRRHVWSKWRLLNCSNQAAVSIWRPSENSTLEPHAMIARMQPESTQVSGSADGTCDTC